MEKEIADIIEESFDHCLDREEMDEDYSDWIHEHTDGTAWDQNVDTDELIELADEGLENYGDYEVNSKDGFRSAITAMAYYGYTSKLGSEIWDWLNENDLEGESHKVTRNDPHPGEWYEEKDGLYLYFSDDEDDDEYEFWEFRDVKIGDKTVEFWIEVTDDHEVNNITRMKRAVERAREEEEGVG
jgi:hypothetical protein